MVWARDKLSPSGGPCRQFSSLCKHTCRRPQLAPNKPQGARICQQLLIDPKEKTPCKGVTREVIKTARKQASDAIGDRVMHQHFVSQVHTHLSMLIKVLWTSVGHLAASGLSLHQLFRSLCCTTLGEGVYYPHGHQGSDVQQDWCHWCPQNNHPTPARTLVQ